MCVLTSCKMFFEDPGESDYIRAEFIYKGTVKDTKGDPVAKMKITVDDGQPHDEALTTATTDEEGKYSIYLTFVLPYTGATSVYLHDPAETQNDVFLQNRVVTVKESDYHGEKTPWFKGLVEITTDFIIAPQEAQQ